MPHTWNANTDHGWRMSVSLQLRQLAYHSEVLNRLQATSAQHNHTNTCSTGNVHRLLKIWFVVYKHDQALLAHPENILGDARNLSCSLISRAPFREPFGDGATRLSAVLYSNIVSKMNRALLLLRQLSVLESMIDQELGVVKEDVE